MEEQTLIDFTKIDYSDFAPFKKTNSETEVLHLSEFRSAISLIKETLERIEQYPSKENEIKRLHNTISILGSRGSGKTSFLMSLKEEINTNDEFRDIQFLDIIDPTLIEAKEHIFVNIVSRVEVLIRRKIECDNSQFNSFKSNRTYEGWEKSLNELSGSIPSIDGVGKSNLYDEWEDSDYILEKGLERANAANNLEVNFNIFLQRSLNILDKKYFIIAFDDVDTDFTKGWEILECIRKYLTSPIILPVISGDISLYSFLVRKKQWSNLDKDITALEDKRVYYLQMVDHLESQYMLKVLKPENRITLTSLYEKISKGKNTIHIKLKNKNNEIDILEIREIYSEIIKDIGINHNISEVSALFLAYPVRTQIRLLKAWIDSLHNDSDFTTHLLDVFWSDIAAHYNHPDEFNREGLLNTIPLLGLLYQNKKIQEAGQYLPFTDNPSLNNAVLAIGANFNNIIKSKKHLIFDYWVRIGSLMNLIQNISYTDKENQPSVKGLMEHAQLLSDSGIRKQSSLIASYLCAVKVLDSGVRTIQSNRDLISLHSFGSKRRNNISRLNECFKGQDVLNKCIGYLPLVGIRHENSLNPVYSFSILLASIAELLQEKDNINEFRNNENSLFLKLQRLSQFREFALPHFLDATKRRQVFIDDDEEEEDSELSNTANYPPHFGPIKAFFSDFENWADNYEEGASIHVLGRIATRFYTSVQRIAKSESLGKVFNRYLILFFNSVLVEDAIEHGIFISDFNNPINDDRIFIHNLTGCFSSRKDKNNEENKDKLKLSKWIISCPLFHCYLENEIKEIINRTLLNNQYKNRTTVYDLLASVNIRKPEKGKEEKTDIQLLMDAQKAQIEHIFNLFQKRNEQQLRENNEFLKSILKEQQERTNQQNKEIIESLTKLIKDKQ